MSKRKYYMISLLAAGMILASGCTRYEKIEEHIETGTSYKENTDEAETEELTPSAIVIENEEKKPERIPVKVKGIYVSAYVAGTASMMDSIIENIDQTELNAVVIDVKDDNGRITFSMDSPIVNEIQACNPYMEDIQGLMKKLKEHDIYTIARIAAFRDPYLAEKKPEWSLKRADGSVFYDRNGLAWVNPHKKEVWEYLIEVAEQAGIAGFDEIQFDYIRFSTEKGMKEVVFDEAEVAGRSKTDTITECITFVYERLKEQGVFVSADVFGTIIGSEIDADSVGQIYGEMAKHLDYICPMIYPSHYADGNFGIEHPDMQPYDTIYGALLKSQEDLKDYEMEEKKQAAVRPWLQAFTASYLKHYIKYGPDELRAQIQAVYDAGYDEWILWSASNKYPWGGLKTAEEDREES